MLLLSLAAALLALAAAAFTLGRRFDSWLAAGNRQLDEARSSAALTDAQLAALPPPVLAYLKRVLPGDVLAGRAGLARARFEQTGRFWTKPGGEGLPFTARQTILHFAPAFSWEARMAMGPVPVRVCDRLIDGRGELQARILGIFAPPGSTATDEAELTRGELLRVMAELPWAPLSIARLPGLSWQERSDRSVEATLSAGGVMGRVTFFFGEQGLIERIRADDRLYLHDGLAEHRPWEGAFSDYQRTPQGLLIPLDGEVRWMLPQGPFTYFKGRLASYVVE
jgi:hypothetical protein